MCLWSPASRLLYVGFSNMEIFHRKGFWVLALADLAKHRSHETGQLVPFVLSCRMS